MPTGYQIVEQSRMHYITFQVVYWIDIFSRKTYRDLFLESLTYCRTHKSLEVYGYVIMRNFNCGHTKTMPNWCIQTISSNKNCNTYTKTL